MPLSPEEQRELDSLELEELEAEEASFQGSTSNQPAQEQKPFQPSFQAMMGNEEAGQTADSDRLNTIGLGAGLAGMGAYAGAPAAARGVGSAIETGVNIARAATSPLETASKLANYLKGVGKAVPEQAAAEAEASNIVQLVRGAAKTPEQLANAAKNKGWTFPVRANRVGMD